MMRLAAASPMIRNTRNSSRNNPARNFAIANDAPAIVVNPSSAAINPTTRNARAMWSMFEPPPTAYTAKAVPHDTDGVTDFLAIALEGAQLGLAEGGIPIGAALVHRDRVLGRGHNRRVQRGSAILHGEMDALEPAGRQSAAVYRECVLYTTLSPCAMCTGAILLYRIPLVVVGHNRTVI